MNDLEIAQALYGRTTPGPQPAAPAQPATLTTAAPQAAETSASRTRYPAPPGAAFQAERRSAAQAETPEAPVAQPNAQPAPTEAPQPKEADSKPANLDAIKALREADVARKLYPAEKTFATAITEEDLSGAEHAVEAAAEFREIFADFQLAPAQASEIVALVRQFAAPARRSRADMAAGEHEDTDRA
jgi:hypothetical protein